MVIDPGGPSHNKGSINSTGFGAKSRALDKAAAAANPLPKPINTTQGDSVSLSSRAQTLVKLEQKIAQAPDVNRQKVDAIKQSIAEGRYKPNAQNIAAAILSDEENYP